MWLTMGFLDADVAVTAMRDQIDGLVDCVTAADLNQVLVSTSRTSRTLV